MMRRKSGSKWIRRKEMQKRADAEDNEEGKGAPQSMRKVQDEEEEVRVVDESREAKFERDLRQLEEREDS